MKISKSDKKEWIIQYMADPRHKNHFIDIVGEEFVNAYVDKFAPKVIEWYPYGAPKVPEIGKLLTELYKEKVLVNNCVGSGVLTTWEHRIQSTFKLHQHKC